MIKAIIFDMDGVIIDSVSFHFGIWSEVMERYNISIDENILHDLNGMDTPSIAEYLCEKFSIGVHPSVIVDEKKRLAYGRMIDGMPFFSGVEDTLKKLKRLGYHIGLGTSSTKNGVELAIGTRLDNLEFDAIATDSDVERGKPAPDIFLKCAELMGVDPQECVVVEDSINGIIAAKTGKMKAIALTTTFPERAFEHIEIKPDLIIHQITEINKELLDGLG
jgi:16S rRNA pseudouridine516 synthase